MVENNVEQVMHENKVDSNPTIKSFQQLSITLAHDGFVLLLCQLRVRDAGKQKLHDPTGRQPLPLYSFEYTPLMFPSVSLKRPVYPILPPIAVFGLFDPSTN